MKDNFEELYNELIRNVSKKTENPIMKLGILLGIILLLIFISYRLFTENFEYLLIGFFVVIIIYLIYFLIEQKRYVINYRKEIVANLIKSVDPNFNYQFKYDIGVWNYKDSKMPEKFDTFSSRDGVYGKLSDNANLKMAYISTNKKIVEKVDGNVKTDNVNTFYGIFGYVNVNKNVRTTVEIKANDFKANYNKKRIELESAEFEKKFDCFADNKIIALQILTPEIIDLINEFSNTINVPIEISIINDIIYFRILIKDIYTPPKIGNPLRRANLKLLYDILFETKKIVTNISNNMMQI